MNDNVRVCTKCGQRQVRYWGVTQDDRVLRCFACGQRFLESRSYPGPAALWLRFRAEMRASGWTVYGAPHRRYSHGWLPGCHRAWRRFWAPEAIWRGCGWTCCIGEVRS